tara:strand:+ start:1576 stop:2670 length:1095 start_codon:yes stop_codon:yes gene_type:complete
MLIKNQYKTAFLLEPGSSYNIDCQKIDLEINYDDKLDLLRLDHNAGYDKVLPAELFTYHIEPEEHLSDLANYTTKILEDNDSPKSISCFSYKDNPLALSILETSRANFEVQKSNQLVEKRLSELKNRELKLISEGVILCRHALEHSDDPLGDLTYLINILGKNSYLLIEIPDSSYQLRNNCIAMLWECHRSYFTQISIEKLIGLAKGEIVFQRRYSYECEDVIAILIKKKVSSDFSVIQSSDKSLINSYIDHLTQVHSNKNNLKNDACTILFGAGHSGLTYMYIHNYSDCIDYIVDDAPDKSNKLTPCSKHRIISSSSLAKLCKGKNLKIISSLKPNKTLKIINSLSEKGLHISSFSSIFEEQV